MEDGAFGSYSRGSGPEVSLWSTAPSRCASGHSPRRPFVGCGGATAKSGGCKLGPMANLELVALVVRDYDPAIRFFVDMLQFELVEDTPSMTNDGRPKRWVVVRPVGAKTGILLARADGEQQTKMIGQQFAGRVGLFLRVDDFDASYERMVAVSVQFVSS